MSQISLQGRIQPLAGLTLRLVVTVVCSGALALYAVGTNWYWAAVRQLPEHLVAPIYGVVASARSLMADDTSVAERQADFISAWFVVCCAACFAWIVAALFRRVWLGHKTRVG